MMRSCLLDLLTDNNPEMRKGEIEFRNINNSEINSQVLRDLTWLLNSINNNNQLHNEKWKEVRRSVINFGLPPLSGKCMSEVRWEDLRKVIKLAIEEFEPRILSRNLTISCLTDINSSEHHNVLSIQIDGYIKCKPEPIEFLFRSELDLEHSRFDIMGAEL